MALLEDPTIQRILDEVNRAASGGALGSAGNYIPEPTKTIKNDYYNQTQAPLFYPTADMYNHDGINNMDFNDIEPIAPEVTPNNFDLYTTGLYDTMPQNILSPYENYKNEVLNSSTPLRPTSAVSSTNNDILSDSHRHQEYPTIPPNLSNSRPNLGLNLRPTPSPLPPQLDTIAAHVDETNDDILPNEIMDTGTASMDLLMDKDDTNSLPPPNNEEIDPPHISSAGRIFYDPNPQIVQRKGANSVTYKQNIIVRFLQPPPIPNAGPLIIKEISSQPQPPLPPLVIKQRPPPPKTPPPLVIREKPPPPPANLATKVITRHLPPEPAPPRAVIIERLPPLPPKPRDIIIERWLPYEIVNQKRKVIVERVQKTSKDLPQTKNVIITYEPVHAKIERHFQKQNVIREDPQAYLNRFGEELCEPATVLQHARAAGVLEDLNPPTAFLKSSTTTINAATDPEYEIKPTAESEVLADELSQEVVHSSVEHAQEDDVLVEENVTPFYMNSGEDLQQTFHRLGIEIPETLLNEHQF